MTCTSELAELLPQYAADTLPEAQRRAVEAHFTVCAACRQELALWQEVGAVVVGEDAALPAPSPLLADAALARAHRQRPNAVVRAWTLFRAQVPLVRHELWLASALVMAVGYLAAVLQGGSQSGAIVGALAPFVAASGLATIYGAENDPAMELALATPTSPRQVLLARAVVVFGYNLLLGVAVTAGLVAVLPAGLLGQIVLGWLAPMTFLSALALVLSMCIGTGNAVTVAAMLWLARGLASGLRLSDPSAPEAALGSVLQTYAQLWHSPTLLFAVAAALLAVAVALAGRQEPMVALGA